MSTPWAKDWQKSDWKSAEWKQNAQWSKGAIRRGLGLELPKNFKPDDLFLEDLGKTLDDALSQDEASIRSRLQYPHQYPNRNEYQRQTGRHQTFEDGVRLNFERLRKDPLNGFASLRYEENRLERENGNEEREFLVKNWLSEWVLPLLFTLLTLACLALLAAEALPFGQAPEMTPAKFNDSQAQASVQNMPIIISAFSG